MDKEDKKLKRSKSNAWELLRFVICGAACALADYLICQLIVLALNNGVPTLDYNWVTTISTAGGFVIGVVLNYLISTFWVYQNVAKKEDTKKPWFIVLFVLLSAGALGLSIGTMLLCNLVSVSAWGIDITQVSLFTMIKDEGIRFFVDPVFWAYFVSFCIKTLVGLVFNYFTRKYILYRAPKKEGGEDGTNS